MKIPILLYHCIAPQVPPRFQRWAIPPSIFTAQMELLRSRSYTPITTSQLVNAIQGDSSNLPDKPVVITFDDGLVDFYTNALPILMNYAYPATLFVVTGFVGRTSQWLHKEGLSNYAMLTWEQISEIASSGVEIGSHGLNHVQLDTLPLEQARQEIVRSQAILEDNLGRRVDTFAYPYGYSSPAVREILPQSGYRSGFAVKHAISSLTDDLFALARIIITSDVGTDRFGELLVGAGLRTAPFEERLQTKAWRTVRSTSAAFKRWISPGNGLTGG